MQSAKWLSFFLLAATGCSAPISEPDISDILNGSPGSSRGGGEEGIEEHDFGPVLARGQTLRHEFVFTNRTDGPVRLSEAVALTPCCSAIGPLSKDAISPGGQHQIPVVLKAVANGSERKRVGFVILTDSKECPKLVYVLRTTFYPELEIRAVGEPTKELAIGRRGRDLLQITCRRVAGDGGTLPSCVEAEPPVIAAFLGEPHNQVDTEGASSASRDVEIVLPPLNKPGPRQANIVFRWPDGRTEAPRFSGRSFLQSA